MNTHENIEELADLATAGAWEPDAHATSCGSCAAAIADARAFQRWTSGLLSADAPPADLEERLIAAFRATGTAAARRFRLLPGKRVLKWAAGVAAVVGVVALGGAFAPSDGLATLASVEHDFRANGDTEDNFPDSKAWNGYLGMPTSGGLGGVEGRGRFHKGRPPVHRYGWAEDFTVTDARKPSFAVEDEGKRNASEKPGDLRLDGSHLAYAGTTFDLARGLIQEPTGEIRAGIAHLKDDEDKGQKAFVGIMNDRIESLEAANAGKGKRLADEMRRSTEDERLLTKLESDVQVHVRQAEVQQAQLQDLAKKLEEKADQARLGAASAGEPPRPTMNDFPGVDVKLAQDNRKLIRTAKLAVEVDGYEAAQAKVAAAAAEEKGYVASADTERLQNGKIRATVTLRVPPDRFEALLAKLRVLGTVKHQTLATEDVGKAYFDMEARMGAKQALLDRLKKILAEAKGSVKELMDVEVQMGATLEQIEALKGELKYLDNQVSLATITLELAEKDLGQPFEYVQTLQSRIGLVAADVDAAYAAAQKAVLDAGGQVVDSKMTRQNDGAATGTIRARVEATKFPDVRQALRALGHVETDTVDQQKTARGGEPTSAAPVRVEQATIDLSVSTPSLLITRRAQVVVEAKSVDAAYAAARQAVEAAGGRVLDGGLSSRTDGGSASLKVQVDVAKFPGLVDFFRAAGEVKHAVVNQSAGVLAVPVRERAEVELILRSPPALIAEEQGIGRLVRDTFARSWGGLLWSVEKLFVGLSLAGPWALAVGIGWLLWRRKRRVNPSAPRSS